jgi:hypothetical protein
MAFNDANCAESGAKLVKDHRANVARGFRRIHQIPDHAGGTPAMAVTDACDECIVISRHRYDAIDLGPRELVCLRRGVHDLETVKPRGGQLIQPLPVIAAVFRK